MGAEFNVRRFDDEPKEEIEKKWNAAIEQAKYDYGHSGYTGSIAEMPSGINWQDDVHFEDRSDAEEYLEENHNKWDRAMAVSYTAVMKDDSTSKRWLIGGWCSS